VLEFGWIFIRRAGAGLPLLDYSSRRAGAGRLPTLMAAGKVPPDESATSRQECAAPATSSVW